MVPAFEDVYGNLEGRRLEALARLFAQNVRIYVYPMTATDLREWLKSVSSTGWEWSETNGWVSASQLWCGAASRTSIRLSPRQQLSCPYAPPFAHHVAFMPEEWQFFLEKRVALFFQ